MAENLFEAQYDLTKKSKLRNFYDKYKSYIYSFIFFIIIIIGSIIFYIDSKEKNKIMLSETYVQAKVFLEKGDKVNALQNLKKVIFAKDSTYSSLSLFMIINQNLITDYNELSELFDNVLKSSNFSKETKSLLIFKKAIYESNVVDESKMLENLKPLLTTDTLLKPHALLLIGDFYVSKKEYIKAIEFYQKIFSLENLHPDIYNHASSQLAIISNE